MTTDTIGHTANRTWLAVWRVADPKITLASVASMVLGAAAAARDGDLAWGWLALTVVGVFCIEAAKNASGDIVDWDSGTDRALRPEEQTPFSGGKRILVDGLVTRRGAMAIAAVFYALGILSGLAIVILREPSVVWLGMLGVGLAFFYHAPPLKLSYHGLGELAVATAYGPVVAAGTYLVQRGTVSAAVVVASVPLGIAIMAFLWANELPDARADASAGKRTLVVRLGRARAARYFSAVIAAAYGAVILLPAFGLPLGVWLGLLGLPHAVRAARRLRSHSETASEMIPAQAWTLQSFLLMSVGLALGLLL